MKSVRVSATPILAWALMACAQALPGDNPGDAVMFYYPTSLVASPDNQTVYVVNSNFDQQFNTGWVTSVDVGQLITNPSNPRAALTRQALIPSLGGRISIAQDGNSAYVPHRGAGLLTVLDVAGQHVSCSGPNRDVAKMSSALKNTSCDLAHLVDLVGAAKNTTQNLPYYTYNPRDFQDPYSVSVLDDANRLIALGYTRPVVVGYLQSGWLSVLDAPATDSVTVKSNITVGSGTLVSFTPHGDSWVLGSSHKTAASSDKSVIYDIDLPASVAPGVQQMAQFIRGDVGVNLGGSDIIDTVFASDQRHVYATNRSPDAVIVLLPAPFSAATTVLGPAGLPQSSTYSIWQVVGAAPLDDVSPTDIVYVPRPSGGDVLAVCSLLQDTVFFFVPRGDQLQLVQRVVLQNGQGPFGMQRVVYNGNNYLFLTTFFDHGLAVIDISSPSYADFHVLTEVHEDDLGTAPRGR